MNGLRQRLLAVIALLAMATTAAAGPLVFTDAAEEARFHALTAQLRCVQSQNQSQADTDALIAQDMRRQVLDLIQQGHSDAQIRDWLVQRYGQFVLYRPALNASTAVLWLLPGGLVLLAAGIGWRLVRRRQALLGQHGPSTHEGDNW